MKKVKSILFRALPNAAHYNFCKQVADDIASAGAAVKTALGDTAAQFAAWQARESACMKWVRRSVLTAQIAAAARRTARSLVSLNTQVRALKYSLTPGVAMATREIYLMLKNYGVVYHKPYGEQCGDLLAIVGLLTGKYAGDVALLGLGSHVTELHDALAEFNRLLELRGAERLHKPVDTFKEARRGIEGVYHEMVVKVNAGAALRVSPDFTALINLLNPEIDRLNVEFHSPRRDISVVRIDGIPPQTYTGSYITPLPGVYYTGAKGNTGKLALGKDYNLTYRNNMNVGTAECTIRGKNLYHGHKTITFNITAC
ncbi:MAG: DUF6261 family protein [Prevotellaceae bacterium]|jgi:hypothetical protein|nr:DUF6261 family protein [Prevotellaceae bacterium]